MPKHYKLMDDLVLEFKGMTDIVEMLKMTIPNVQSTLQRQQKEGKVSIELLEEIADVEKKGKNRKSLLRWIRHGIKIGEVPGKYYLDFLAEVGIWKSALQKYIRRSNVEKAVKAAAKLNAMQPASLTRRLKVILCEDCYSSIDLYSLIDVNPILVAGYAAERPKDGHCCRAFNEIKNLREYEKGYDIEWIKENWKTGDLSKLMSMIFAMESAGVLPELDKIIGKDIDLLPTRAGRDIMNELLTSSKVDYWITLQALIRMLRDGYEIVAEKTKKTRYNKTKKGALMELSEVDWIAYDMHTFPGRVVRDVVAKNNGIDRSDLGWMWWFGETSIRLPEEEPPKDYEKFYMTAKEKKGIENWKKYKEEIITKLYELATECFKINMKKPEDE